MTALTSPEFAAESGASAAPWYSRMLVNRLLGWALVMPLALMIALTSWQYMGIEAHQNAGVKPDASLLIAGGAAAKQRVLNDYEDFYVGVDSLIMGARTWDFMVRHGSWPYGGKPTWIVSRRTFAQPARPR